MRAVIVDDERLSRARLRKLLEVHPEVIVVAEADSVAAAKDAIAQHAPDVIFLDITMPGGSGFDLLAQLRIDASVVFVTAYDAHAIRAFDVGAVDYLLKPIAAARLAASIERLRTRVVTGPPADRICVTVGGTLRVVVTSDIVLVRADGDYSELVFRDGTTAVQKEPLASWEQRLASGFVRVSRGMLVSIADVERLERVADASTYQVVVRGHGIIPVSRSRGTAVKAVLRGDEPA